MATSSFDVSFRVRTQADAEVFIKALEESSNAHDRRPKATRYKGDLSEVNRKILERYGKHR